MSFIYALADTWNAIGTTFNSILMNVSNGAGGAPVGAAASRILNLQSNSTTVFDIDVNGILTKQFQNTVASSATSVPATFTQTWNAAGVTFQGISLVITNTASGVNSQLLSATVGGASRLSLLVGGFFGLGAAVPLSQIYASGIGQATASAFSTVGALGATLYLSDSAGGVNNGGAVLFGAAQGAWGVIKGMLTGGGNNTTGDLLIATRRVDTDATLTNAVYITGTTGFFGINTVPAVQLHTTGNVRFANFGVGTATFDASGNISSVSDERLKNVLGMYKDSLSKLIQLEPIEYSWKPESNMETEHSYIGFSAQNIRDVAPELSGTNHEGYLSFQDRGVLALLVNSVKELNEKVERLH